LVDTNVTRSAKIGSHTISKGEEQVLRPFRSKKRWSAAVVGVAVIGIFAAVALGSMPFNFTPTTLVTGNLVNRIDANHNGVKFQTGHPVDVRVQKIVFGPGGYSGWHHHPGIVIAVVESGVVTFTKSDCSSKSYGPGLATGSVFVESDDEPGQASSTDGATAYATFYAPHAVPPVFRIEDTPPRHCK
jgi:quercetin dioxygenase-like cupin family protein